MSTPNVNVDIPCCSPATTESVAVVRDKVADARSDILVGQGHILKSQGDYTSAILRDANANTLAINGNTDRGVYSIMGQSDAHSLANLNNTRAESDKLGAQTDRAAHGLSQDIHGESDKITGQAGTIAWAQNNMEGRRFGEVRSQNERINDAQSAYSDRAFKFLQQQTSDSFSRLSVQGENGFYRTQSALNSGFSDVNNNAHHSYSRLSEQNCDIKAAIAAAQSSALQGYHDVKHEVLHTGKELGIQAAQNFGAVQIEASKNTAAIQLQAAANAKESLVEQAKWFALAEKTAMINKCELEAKLAACCCEIKEAVHGTAATTQGMIQSAEAQRLRDALSAASTENAILKLRNEDRYSHHHYYRDHRRDHSPGPR